MEQGRRGYSRVEPKGGQWIASIDVSEFLLVVVVVVVCTLHFALQAVRQKCGEEWKREGEIERKAMELPQLICSLQQCLKKQSAKEEPLNGVMG